MSTMFLLIGSQAESTIALCKEIATEMDIATLVKTEIEDFLLAIQEDNFNAIVLDLEMIRLDRAKVIRIIKQLRPKIPLIIITANINKTLGGKFYTEGVFQLILKPPDRAMLRSAFAGVLKKYADKKRIQIIEGFSK